MQTTQAILARSSAIVATSLIESLVARGEDVHITLDEFFASNEYDSAPSEVELTITPQTIWALRKAAEAIERNPCFDSISINPFDWNVESDYEGKARYGRLTLIRAGHSFEIEFSFINDYTDTRFSAHLDYQDTKTLLSAPLVT